MRPDPRSISGAILMLVIIPIIAGLFACMPVPIGDPERSRIDRQMSGWWAMEDESGAGLAVFRPYDRRTWLVFMVSLEKGELAGIGDFDLETAGDVVTVLRANTVGTKGVVADAPSVYKAWLTRLGGERFMTWEPVGQIEDQETFYPDAWFVFKVTEQTEDLFVAAMINAEHKAFDGLIDSLEEEETDPWKARKHWERAIRKHADDPELYDSDILRFRRLPEELESKAARIVALPFDY